VRPIVNLSHERAQSAAHFSLRAGSLRAAHRGLNFSEMFGIGKSAWHICATRVRHLSYAVRQMSDTFAAGLSY
jgi:hypothetical protein